MRRTARHWRMAATLLLLLLPPLLGAGCAYPKKASRPPAPPIVKAVPDAPFTETTRGEYLRADVEGYLSGSPQPPNPVKAVAAFGGRLYAGTNNGLYVFDGANWNPQLSGRPIYRLLAAGDVYDAGSAGSLIALQGGAQTEQKLPVAAPVSALAVVGDRLYVGLETGLLAGANGQFAEIADLAGQFVFDLVADAHGVLWAGTQQGLLQIVHDRVVAALTTHDFLLSSTVRALAFDADGQLWIGGDGGLNRLGTDGKLVGFTGAQGLPYVDITGLAFSGSGASKGLWIATNFGVIRYDGENWNYFAGRRWIPNNGAADVAIGGPDQVVIGTQNGLSVLQFAQQSLAGKAAAYLALTEARHNRDGLVAACHLDLPGDLATARQAESDNDGLSTAMYVAALSYQYAVTGDENARHLADEHFAALLLLDQVSGIPGLSARSVAPLYSQSANPVCTPFCQWQANPTAGYDWESDEGSDELTGHFFAYAVYYDLAADGAHKAQVSAATKAIMDYILRHNYTLPDWDGEPTSTGVWNPSLLWQWANQPTLQSKAQRLALIRANGLAILMYLRVAMHIVGDATYAAAYQQLIAQNSLADFVVDVGFHEPVLTNYYVDQLLYLDYVPLLTYETDETLLFNYLASLQRTWSLNRLERNSLFNVVFGALTGAAQDFALPDAVGTLQDIPLDLVDWKMTNSQRADVTVDAFPNRLGQELSDTAAPPLPVAERVIALWSDDPYTLDAGGFGESEQAGTFWLLPYWMARYYQFITD